MSRAAGRAKFGLFEKVRVLASDPPVSAAVGQFGVVVGMEESPLWQWRYAVVLYRDGERCLFGQAELESAEEYDRIGRRRSPRNR